jgi:GDP-fucose transporter C1
MASSSYIVSVVGLYWFVSISMVYLNKVLMSSEDISISAPLFVTWFQCVVTAVICWAAGKFSETMQKRADVLPTRADANEATKGHGRTFFSQFPKAEYKASIGKRVLPLSFAFVGMIALNNICLQLVEVSFYNVARSLTIVFNVFLSRLILGSPASLKTIMCLGVVVLGLYMGANGEVNFSYHGTVAGVCSSLFVALNAIFTKKVLPAVDNDHWKLTFYHNINAIIMFLPLMAYFEAPVLLEAIHQQFSSPLFWSGMMVSGFFGFCIGIVTVLQIKATSPLSHNISGTVKAAVQSMLAFYLWKNPATVQGVLGMFVVLGGSLLYTIVKMREGKKAIPISVAAKPVTKVDVEMRKN